MNILLKVRHISFGSLVALLVVAAIAVFVTVVGVGAYYFARALVSWGILT